MVARAWPLLFLLLAVTGCDPEIDTNDDDGDGYPANQGDCNDSDATVNPGATELCDGADNNCNGQSDEELEVFDFYRDLDGDGFGDLENPTEACAAPAGYVSDFDDCDDGDPDIFPGATETCNETDDDCDGEQDEQVTSTYFRDADQDGYGDALVTLMGCEAPDGYVSDDQDCDDQEEEIHPGADELCNEMDDDCDEDVDEGISSVQYTDTDGDGYGDPESSSIECDPDQNQVSNDDDCDDTDAAVYAGADEVCNGVDDDCDSEIDEGSDYCRDDDDDGFGDPTDVVNACAPPENYVSQCSDCDDTHAAVRPDALETCNGVDDDCDGTADDGLDQLVGYLADSDGDGFGGSWVTACQRPTTGTSTSRGDCDDTEASTHPGAEDAKGDGVDQDCGGSDGPQPHVGLSSSSLERLSDALADAATGDTVWVGPGLYAEYDLSFAGRGIALKSTDLADDTTIDAGGSGQAVSFGSVDGSDAILDGFTIQNTYGDAIAFSDGSSAQLARCIIDSPAGVGISSSEATPTLTGCEVRDGSSYGLKFVNSNGSVIGCLVRGNSAGGIYLESSSPLISNSVVSENATTSGKGAGLYLYDGSSPQISNCIISDNTATSGGGIYMFASCKPALSHCVVAGNSGSGVYVDQLYKYANEPVIRDSILVSNSGYNLYVTTSDYGWGTIEYNDFYSISGGQNSNVSGLDDSNLFQEPGFLEYDDDGLPTDYHLSLTSELINAGYPSGKLDVDGTRSDLGIYGGDRGDDWNLDGDGRPAWFWPGTRADAPGGIDVSLFDCDDTDPTDLSCL